jgi:hypothetical protein
MQHYWTSELILRYKSYMLTTSNSGYAYEAYRWQSFILYYHETSNINKQQKFYTLPKRYTKIQRFEQRPSVRIFFHKSRGMVYDGKELSFYGDRYASGHDARAHK